MKKVFVIDNYDSFTYNLVHNLEVLNCEVTVKRNDQFKLEELKAYPFIMLSPGPGIPDESGLLKAAIELYAPTKKILGICLGHQILGLACGLKVKKMQFGHHGSNHPVEIDGVKKALITAQNHGFSIEEFGDSYKHKNFGNINVFANEGISLWDSMAYSVQFHPESGPGTTDGLQIFNPFFEMIENNYAKK